jgi:hypothetical protein
VTDPFNDTPEGEWPATPRKRRAIDGVDRHAYQVLREAFLRESMARRADCWLCGEPIDYNLISGQPLAFETRQAPHSPLGPGTTLAGFQGYPLAGTYLKNRVRRVVAQKTVVIPRRDGLYVLQLNGEISLNQSGMDLVVEASNVINKQTMFSWPL